MASKRQEEEDGASSLCAPSVVEFYPIWHVSRRWRFQVYRFLFTALALCVTVFCICLLAVLSDMYYFPESQRPLPDRVHDQLLGRQPMPDWMGKAVDVLTFMVVFLTYSRCLFLLPFPFNLQVTCRYASLMMAGFWLRAVAVVVTTVPPSKPDCVPRHPETAAEFFVGALKQATGRNVECTGMIISGHSLNVMHAVMCWLYYGRCGTPSSTSSSSSSRSSSSSSSSRRSRRGCCCCCRDVTCGGESEGTLKSCFAYQCFAFIKTWLQLRREGSSAAPMYAAAARCFAAETQQQQQQQQQEEEEEEQREQQEEGEKGKKKGGSCRGCLARISWLPLLRYICYIQAVLAWVLIPLCYNHYTVDVYLALLLGFFMWAVYHLLLTILLVQHRALGAAASGVCTAPAAAINCSSSSSSSSFATRNAGRRPSAAKSSNSLQGGIEPARDQQDRNEISICMQRDTAADSGASDAGAPCEGPPEVAVEGAPAPAPAPAGAPDGGPPQGGPGEACELGPLRKRGPYTSIAPPSSDFAQRFAALNLDWLADFPVLLPISWCIRKMEGI